MAILCLTFENNCQNNLPPTSIEGSELLDYDEDDLYLVYEDVERESESDERESGNENGEVEAENKETQIIIWNETVQPKVTISSFMNVCDDPLIKNDAKF